MCVVSVNLNYNVPLDISYVPQVGNRARPSKGIIEYLARPFLDYQLQLRKLCYVTNTKQFLSAYVLKLRKKGRGVDKSYLKTRVSLSKPDPSFVPTPTISRRRSECFLLLLLLYLLRIRFYFSYHRLQ